MSHAAAGRLLVALYSVLALAAGARALVQLATRFSAAPVAYALSLAAALVYLAIAVGLRVPGGRARWLVWFACVAELVGVLSVGAFTLAAPDTLGDQTVWTDFGAGYGFVPLMLPAAALWWIAHLSSVKSDRAFAAPKEAFSAHHPSASDSEPLPARNANS